MTPSAIRDIHELGVQLRLRHPERTLRALHVGEGNLGTPEFIVEAGVRALRAGAVFYEANRGRPDLTGELAAHYQRLYGVPLTPEHFVVSSGGVQAILLTMLGLLAPGDQVINITPAWPNFREAALIAGGEVHDLALRFDATRHRFTLDLPSLETLAATLPTLRMVVVNSPSNPTGCVLETSEKRALLEFCHRRGLVLLADEMYDRLVYREPAPPSFLQLWREERLVVINGFSKAYAMTGWRLGYLITAPALATRLAQMQEFVTSCAPAMLQVAAVTALRDGEAYVTESRRRYQGLRDLTLARLRSLPGATVAMPEGAFYAFFRLPGSEDSVAFCKTLVEHTGVMLAPGRAFGGGGEGWLRLCFAKDAEVLEGAFLALDEFMKHMG